MPRKIVTFRDKYNSTTRLYPKIIMDSLTPEVKAYIEGQGEDKYVKKEEVKSQYKSSKILSEGDEISLLITDTESDMFGNIRISDSEFIAEVGTTDNDYYQIGLTNTGDFAITTNDGTNTHQLTFDAEGNLKVDGQAVGGGKQLYQHNIYFYNAYTRLSGTSYPTRGTITIINDSNIPMTFESISQFLAQNDFKCAYADLGTNTKWYGNVNIETKVSSSYKQNYGICTDSDITYWCVVQTWGSTGTINKTTTLDGIPYTINITDTIVAL